MGPCPHPNDPVERHVGSHVSLVCRDCGTRMAPPVPEPEPEVDEKLLMDADQDALLQ